MKDLVLYAIKFILLMILFILDMFALGVLILGTIFFYPMNLFVDLLYIVIPLFVICIEIVIFILHCWKKMDDK